MRIEVVRRALLLLPLLLVANAEAATYYVSTQGSDSNPGTSAQPFRTITRAYSLAAPGVNIIVMPGTYTDYQTGWGLHLGASGTASSPIVLRSQVPGGAIIDGQNASDRNVGIYIDGNYNVVDGFEIKNGPRGGLTIWSNGNRILNCVIHHNGNVASTSTSGMDGIYSDADTTDNIYTGNYIHHNGRTGSTLDHGLYVCGRNELVNNNIVVANSCNGIQVAGYTTVSNLKIYNNVFAYNGGNGIILWQTLSGVDIKNNVLYNNTRYAINSYNAHGSGVTVNNNLSFGNGVGQFNFTAGASDYAVTMSGTLNVDPKFVNGTAASFDAHLTETSPARLAGINLSSTFATDISGALRPSSGAWDLGVYQYGSTKTESSVPSVNVAASVSTAVIGTTNWGKFTFTRTGSTSSALTVNYSLGGPAVKGTDYYRAPEGDTPVSITIPAGSASYTMKIAAKGNQTGANPEFVTLTLSSNSAYVIGSPSNATLNIVSNTTVVSQVPTVTISAPVSTAVIGTTNWGKMTFTRTGSTTSALNVDFSLGGSAVKWNDYYRVPEGDMPVSITIPAGSASYTLNIAAKGNQTGANPEFATLTLSANSSYQIGSSKTATLNIVANTTVVVAQQPMSLSIQKVAGGMKLSWTSVSGKTYRVASKNDMTSQWTDLSGTITATGTSSSWTDTAATAKQRFYRVYSTN